MISMNLDSLIPQQPPKIKSYVTDNESFERFHIFNRLNVKLVIHLYSQLFDFFRASSYSLIRSVCNVRTLVCHKRNELRIAFDNSNQMFLVEMNL